MLAHANTDSITESDTSTFMIIMEWSGKRDKMHLLFL